MTPAIAAPSADVAEVRIRAGFPHWKAARLWSWLNTPRGPNFDDFGTKDEGAFAIEFARRLETHRTWGIFKGKDLVGYIAFLQQSPVCGQFQGMVIAPKFRGLGIGRRALGLVVSELRTIGLEKFLAMVYADNAPIVNVFRHHGFIEEGYITRATRRDGAPLDVRILALPGRVKCHSADC